MKAVYEHYDYLRYLTEKRYKDPVLADEAHAFAFEKLAEDNWKRVRAYKGKSHFRNYLAIVWKRLLEDFSYKKYGKTTAPAWIKRLGGLWEELFKLLCRRRFSVDESVEKISAANKYEVSAEKLEIAAYDILAEIPNCGRKYYQTVSSDDENAVSSVDLAENDDSDTPETMVIAKEKWTALKAVTRLLLNRSEKPTSTDITSSKIASLVTAVRRCLPLTAEEQFILTAYFVDEYRITEIGKLLGLNSNQVHGKFRRLMDKIKRTLPGLIDPFL